MVSESNLYLCASIFAVISSLVCAKFIIDKPSGPLYGIYLVGAIGLLSISKAFEYYEKSIYKNKNKR
tara:strand:+ start:375 stop:575 length:201 start_codon:yes stop_codon:yes gene_type:complete